MSSALAIAVAVLATAVILLAVSLTAIRVRIRRQRRRQRRYGPGASRGIARYLAGAGDPPRPAGRVERAIFRDVALAALTDLRGSEREELTALLGQLGYFDEAQAALTAHRRSVRRRAAEMLALAGTAPLAPALVTGLSDRDPLVRTSCARTLAQAGAEDVIPEVTATAAQDIESAPGAAAAVVLALGNSHPAALTPMLRAGAAAPVREVALEVAGRLRLAELSPSLRACLHDGDDLAATAAEGLGLIGDIEAAGALRDLASDHGRALAARTAAVTALGSIGDPASVPLLEPLLESGDWPIRAAAARALGKLGEPGAAVLRRAAWSARPEVREQAEAVLQP
jgi:HEAT repeat protein